MNDYKIATIFNKEEEVSYKPIVNGKELPFSFSNYDQALILAISYANLNNLNDANFAETFISRMLKINQ